MRKSINTDSTYSIKLQLVTRPITYFILTHQAILRYFNELRPGVLTAKHQATINQYITFINL